MVKLKILNLYAGIGGNRKLWPNDKIEVTAIEINPEIAKIYKDFFPNDEVIVTDAHEYLLKHYNEFDFIWSSPPCPSHSRIRIYSAVASGQNEPIFPDMKLYEEIIFLQYYFKNNYVVENVISFYDPLIKPFIIGDHYFWSNCILTDIKTKPRGHFLNNEELQERKGFDLDEYSLEEDKKKILRNCVEPELGLHIFNMISKEKQGVLKI